VTYRQPVPANIKTHLSSGKPGRRPTAHAVAANAVRDLETRGGLGLDSNSLPPTGGTPTPGFHDPIYSVTRRLISLLEQP